MILGGSLSFPFGAGSFAYAIRANGVDLSSYIQLDSVRRETRVIGERRRAFAGGLRNDVSSRRQVWTARTIPLAEEVAEAIRCFVNGEGENWPFDSDAWSAQGSVATLTGCSVTASGKWSNGAVYSSVSGTVVLPLRSSTYTVVLWRKDPATATWEHWFVRSDGTKYKNGAVHGSSIAAWWSVTGTTLTLSNGHATLLGAVDDVVALPCLFPTDWAAGVYTEAGLRAWTPIPRFQMSGSIIGSSRLIVGAILDASYTAASGPAGGWSTGKQVLTLTLEDA